MNLNSKEITLDKTKKYNCDRFREYICNVKMNEEILFRTYKELEQNKTGNPVEKWAEEMNC